MKHNPMATANAAALTIGIFYIVCRILVGILPDLMQTIAQSWFHGLTLGSWSLNSGNFVLGILSASVTAWIVGYTFAVSYNSFTKR